MGKWPYLPRKQVFHWMLVYGNASNALGQSGEQALSHRLCIDVGGQKSPNGCDPIGKSIYGDPTTRAFACVTYGMELWVGGRKHHAQPVSRIRMCLATILRQRMSFEHGR